MLSPDQHITFVPLPSGSCGHQYIQHPSIGSDTKKQLAVQYCIVIIINMHQIHHDSINTSSLKIVLEKSLSFYKFILCAQTCDVNRGVSPDNVLSNTGMTLVTKVQISQMCRLIQIHLKNNNRIKLAAHKKHKSYINKNLGVTCKQKITTCIFPKTMSFFVNKVKRCRKIGLPRRR